MYSNIPFILDGCTLFCQRGYFRYFYGFVKDGTKCLHGSEEGDGFCIGGECMV